MKRIMRLKRSAAILGFLLFNIIFFSNASTAYPQVPFQPSGFTAAAPPQSFIANSTAFKQEIARMEISVVRQGRADMPITEVPRLEMNDILKVRMLDEAVNGVKPDQSNFDWTFVVAFVNPGRNADREKSVSEEVQFKKSGWYKEYSFVVPYDSQPIFFLYPKPKYRAKILNLLGRNQDEIRKIGEKTIEIADAYAKIGSFLSELQTVVNRNSYNQYGSYGSTGGYGFYGTGAGGNQNALMEQSIERLARSFNIQLPGCWQNGNYGYNAYNNSVPPVNNGYGASPLVNNGYNGASPLVGGGYNGGYPVAANDFVGRVQCVAKSVRLEDFDLSVSRLLQQGGILLASQLAQKYPQIAFWINIAAAALDVIIKITRKTPLKIVPTIFSAAENQTPYLSYQNASGNAFSNSATAQPPPVRQNLTKVSLFAETSPSDSNVVTAYPLVVHKWQSDPDPKVIQLPTPVLLGQCLEVGQNVLRNTDLMTDWMADKFTKDFKLTITASNGFRKEFALSKNAGLNGWEFALTKEELNALPKGVKSLEAVMTGKRGFNEVKTQKFSLPAPPAGIWEIKSRMQTAGIGNSRIKITLQNTSGSCRCLQSVVYTPVTGRQIIFDAASKENGLTFSSDGREVSFIVEASSFLQAQTALQLMSAGGEIGSIKLKTEASAPKITDLKIIKGARQATISGDGLEQIQYIRINGIKAQIIEKIPAADSIENQNPNQRIAVFENKQAEILTEWVFLELGFKDGKTFFYPQKFNVGLESPKSRRIVSPNTAGGD